MTVHDELVGGSERLLRRVPRRVLAALALAAVALFGADRWQEHRETASLLRCVTAGEEQVRYTERRIAATASYASPVLGGASTPPAVRRSLQQVVQAVAAQAVRPTQAVVRTCGRPAVLPWHATQRRARGRYVDYLTEQVAHLAAAGTDFDALSTSPPGLVRSRMTARAAVLRALAGDHDRGAVRVRSLLSP